MNCFSRLLLILIFLAVLLCGSPVAQAGNPLYVSPQGTPLVWDTASPIKYIIDSKNLGQLTHEQAQALIEQALQVWSNVSDTGLSFEYEGQTSEDISIDNWTSIAGNTIYAEGESSHSTSLAFAQQEHLLVFGFDNTGQIMAAKGAANAAGLHSITGVSGTYAEPQNIISAQIFFSGKFYDGSNTEVEDLSSTDLLAIMVHEIGHALGLEHSLANASLYTDMQTNARPLETARYLPTMFPRFLRGTGDWIVTLNPDDVATLQWLYDTHTTLVGEVVDANRAPQEAALVTARATDSALCQVFSQVTGTLCGDRNSSMSGSGQDSFNALYCLDESRLGTFEIPVESETDYVISVESIDELYDSSITRLLGQVLPLASEAEFFNAHDAAEESADAFDTLSATTQVTNIDFVLSFSEAADGAATIDLSFFEDSDLFETRSDAACPTLSSIDADAIIADPSVNESTVDMSSTAGGCALDRGATSTASGLFFWIIGATLLAHLRRAVALMACN